MATESRRPRLAISHFKDVLTGREPDVGCESADKERVVRVLLDLWIRFALKSRNRALSPARAQVSSSVLRERKNAPPPAVPPTPTGLHPRLPLLCVKA